LLKKKSGRKKRPIRLKGARRKKLEKDLLGQARPMVEVEIMTPPFDIFQVETDGNVRWLEAAVTFEGAKARVQELALRLPGEYLLLDQKTGNRLVIKLDGVDGASGR
jgi:hypothetical protein